MHEQEYFDQAREEGVTQIEIHVATGSITLDSGTVLQLPKGTFTVSLATMEAIVAANKRTS